MDEPAADAATEQPEAPSAVAATSAEAAVAAAALVSFQPRAAGSTIAIMPEDGPAVMALRSPRSVATPAKALVRPMCARPTGRVPLSQRCKQVQAVAVLRVTLTYSSSPAEVRAAIVRVVPRVAVRRVDARPPPDSKAAKKHPVAEVRPTVPFGDSGQGAIHDGFSGSTGSTWSSRVFALAPVPMRVPLPRRFARLRVPSTIPHGVIAAPPTARPG